MSTPLEQFLNMLQPHANKQHGSAISAAAKKHPVGYTAYIKKLIAGTPNTAEGFDRALAELKAAGLSRAETMSQACRNHPARGLWVQKVNEDRRRGEKAPAAAPRTSAAPTLQQPAPTQATAPVVIAAAPPVATAAASTPAPATHQVLSAADLAELRNRWEKFPALRAVYGDDFGLLVSLREGRITQDEVKSLREATASKQSREMWAAWEASQRRISQS